MNPIYSSLPRETETHRCCNIVYRRWRFVGKRFNKKHPAHCRACGERIDWNDNFTQYKKYNSPAKNRLEKYHDQAVTFRLMGLTTHGKARRRNLVSISIEERNRRMLASYYARRDKLAAKGLTTRGTNRKLFRREMPAIEKIWRELRSTIPNVIHIEDYNTADREIYA